MTRWFLTGTARPYASYNMESLINKSANKYICFYSFFKVRGVWNKGQLLKAGHWCRRRRCRGVSAPPKLLIWWKSGQKHSQSGQNLWKFGKNSQNRCMCFDFTKMAPKIKVQTLIFLWRSCFYLVLFGQVRGNLGKFGGNLGKYVAWSALIWKNAPNMKCNAVVFFGGHFLWSIFRQVWGMGKFGQKSFAPSKICLLLHLQYEAGQWFPNFFEPLPKSR